jgi:protein-S-isoprenylcysteine O-methyltransferase Ste14
MSTAKAPNGSRRWSGGNISLTARNVLFSLVVPGLGAVLVPWWILDGARAAPLGPAWLGVIPVAAGLVLYLACVRVFAAVGRGTPGPWDAPRQVVTVGPYGWVRNPIYLAALLVVLGETCIFQSGALLGYAAAMAVGFHLFVVGYEEPHLRRAFGSAYIDYCRRVHRWLPRPAGATRDQDNAVDQRRGAVLAPRRARRACAGAANHQHTDPDQRGR